MHTYLHTFYRSFELFTSAQFYPTQISAPEPLHME